MTILVLASPCLAAFEETQTDARVYGMAGAGAALADFPQAGAINPALPAFCEMQSVNAGAGLPFGLKDLAATATAVSYQRGRYGLAAGIAAVGNQLYREATVRMALGMRVFERAAIGAAVNGHHLGIARYGSATAVGFDAGLIGSPFENLTLAVAAGNLNHPAIGESDEEISQTLSCGASFRPVSQVTLAVQLQAQENWPVQLRVGQEYRYRDRLFLRAGFTDRPNQASLGFGAAHGKFRLDYAVRTHPVLNLSHCLSLHYETQRVARFEKPKTATMTQTKPLSLAKLDLNAASHSDLLLLPGIGEVAAKQILALRDSLGSVASLNDLSAIKGLTNRDLERVAPYTVQELKRVEIEPVKVNINDASAEELGALPGIGPGTAEDIITHRIKNGRFKHPEDLMDVKGIGRVKFEKMKDLITVEP
ncbi:MAG: helix-hairpin-helix domain-containing protein [Candidatus Edwardsbacteria bacterium]|nr:helix-hairpin-helix domain-containing protein [Candidatus Edwardsbacteria bacterium]